MKKIFILLILSIFSYAKINIDLSKEIIQLGAFKNDTNIKKLQNSFKEYQVYIKTYPNKLKKIFIVNIKKKDLQNILKKVKPIIHNAFVVKTKDKKSLFKENKQNDWLKNSLSKTDEENIQKLDSKAIIKTRKKFFK